MRRYVGPGGVGGVVLAGGAARRMGGVDKSALPVAGVGMLDRVLMAARPLCEGLVVVGPLRPTVVDGVQFVQERRPAVLAGFRAVGAPDVCLVLATDLPLITTAALTSLLAVLDREPAEAVAAIDDRGSDNPLLAAYRRRWLCRATVRRLPPGAPARALLPTTVTGIDLGGEAARFDSGCKRKDNFRRTCVASLPHLQTMNPVPRLVMETVVRAKIKCHR
jgi:molybdopterin-guanine dinucleotide biosynthesis protein A